MFELTAVIGDLSTPVKVGWTLWFAWGVISLGWYRHARVVSYVAPAMPSRFTPPPPADEVMEPHEEDPTYSDPTGSSYSDSTGSSSYSDPSGSPYRDSSGSSYGDSSGSSSPNY